MAADQAAFVMSYRKVEEWCISFKKRPKEGIVEYQEEREKQEKLDTWHIFVQKENKSMEH